MDAPLCQCCCRTMFPASHKLSLDNFQVSELWKSGRLRQQQLTQSQQQQHRRIWFPSPRASRMCHALWIGLVLVLGTLPTSTVASCSGLGRSVLTDLEGIITDGPDKYPEDEHCEWLIIGKLIWTQSLLPAE